MSADEAWYRRNHFLFRSVVFDRMLDQNMKEAQEGEVDIIDVDPDTFKRMLEFIYTGQVAIANGYQLFKCSQNSRTISGRR